MVAPRLIDESGSVLVIHAGRNPIEREEGFGKNLRVDELEVSGSTDLEIAVRERLVNFPGEEAGSAPVLVMVALPVARALAAGRLVRRMAHGADLLFVVPDREMQEFRRKSIYTPLGRYGLVHEEDPAAVRSGVLERLQASGKRRAFRSTIDRMNVQLTSRKGGEPSELRRLTISDRYRASILASAADAIFSIDREGLVMEWNRSAERLFDVKGAAGCMLEELPLGDCGRELLRSIQDIFAGGGVQRREIGCEIAGRRVDIAATFTPVLDDDSEVIGVSVIARDVSEAKRAERLLRLEHNVSRRLVEGGELREVIEGVLESIAEEANACVAEFWSMDATGKFLWCEGVWHAPSEDRLANFTAVSRGLRLEKGEGLPGRVWAEPGLAVLEDAGKNENFPRAEAARKAGIHSGFAFPVLSPSEFLGTINVFFCREFKPDEPLIRVITAVATDIAQYVHRRRAEEALKESTQRMRFMSESMPQKIFTATAEGEVDYLNKQWTEFAGVDVRELLDWGWAELLHPDDANVTLQGWKEALRSREGFEIEHRFRRHDGVYRWHLSRALPMRKAGGEVLFWIGSNTDIDDQKREEERLERVVEERTAKLQETVAELESFSYSVSHDMRAPLRAMQQYAQIVQEEQGERLTPDGAEQLGRIVRAANRLDRLIQDILTYTRISRENLVLEKVDLNRLVEEAIQQYQELSGAGAEVRVDGPLLPVLGHEPAVMQCVTNLLGNAVKFVAPGKTARVRIWTEERGDRTRLNVEDNGVGISKEDQKRIFGIFVRIHPERAYAGTGIGLSIVRKAVHKMGGTLGVESEPGKGSTFWIELQKG